MKCIFCDDELSAETKPEHILLSCLGGHKITRMADCSKHNEQFGSTIDNEVAGQVRVIRNLLQLESGTRKQAPGLKNIKAVPRTFDFDSDGQPRLVGEKPFTITKRSDGSLNISIKVPPERLNSIIPHISAAAKMSEERLRDLLRTSDATLVYERPGIVHHQLSFGGGEALRSAVKSALVLWTLVAGNNEVRSNIYSEARNFVLAGGDFNIRRAHLDSRPIPGTDDLVQRFGNFFNLLYIASNAEGRVVGHFTLYNMIGWQMILAEKGGSPNLKIGIINNPLKPKDWSDAIATDAPIPFDWFDSPTYADNFERSRERITNMMQKHFEDARSMEWDSIIRDVFEKNGVAEGAAITDQSVIKKISGDIAYRIASHTFNIPYTEQLTPEQIAKLL